MIQPHTAVLFAKTEVIEIQSHTENETITLNLLNWTSNKSNIYLFVLLCYYLMNDSVSHL